MIDTLRTVANNIISIISEYIPERVLEALPDGGILALFSLFAAGFVILFSKVLAEFVQDYLKKSLTKSPRLIGILLFVFIMIILSVTSHMVTLGFTVICGVLTLIVYKYKPHLLKRWWIFVVQISIFLGILIAEEWQFDKRRRILNANIDAYFVLPFTETESGNKVRGKLLDELKDLWEIYHKTLKRSFSGVESINVSILPQNPDSIKYNDYLDSAENIWDRLVMGDLKPDLALENQANIIQTTKPGYLIIYTKLKHPKINPPPYFRNIGLLDDIKYIALRHAFDFLTEMKALGNFKMTVSDELLVKKNILEMYKEFLMTRKEYDPQIIRKIEATVVKIKRDMNKMMSSKFYLDEEIRTLLTRYGEGIDRDKLNREAASARRAAVGKIKIFQ